MKTKLIGFCEMKKRKGKVVFLTVEGQNGVNGTACKVEYLYDAMSDRITARDIGHELQLVYNAGYNGKAFISDIIIK